METDEDFYQLLSKSGWKPNREIDVVGIASLLSNRGYSPQSSFFNFMKEFGELFIEFRAEGKIRSMSFSVSESIGIEYDELILEAYPKAIGCETLVPIGNVNGEAALVIDDDGLIYSLIDGFILCFGKGAQAISNGFNQKNIKEVPTPDWW